MSSRAAAVDSLPSVLRERRLAAIGALAGMCGVLLIATSFAINNGPPDDATTAVLTAFARQHLLSVMWGAWMQAVGPALIVAFALTVVHLTGANRRLAGWLTLFGGCTLMLVSLTETVFYMSAVGGASTEMALLSLTVIHAVQHLYFFIAAPSLFIPLGVVILSAPLLPRVFGYTAILLGAVFTVVGVATIGRPVLPAPVTSMGAIQAIWWLLAAAELFRRAVRQSAMRSTD